MTKIYNVHIYRELRLAFAEIEADSHEQAAEIARRKLTDEADSIEDCDGESSAALVNVHGAEGYLESRAILFEDERIRRLAPVMLRVLKLVAVHLAERRDLTNSAGEQLIDEILRAIALAAPDLKVFAT